MGRTPKVFITAHFTRGNIKLSDKSNRYPQTCKHCSIHFEKGRPETLIHHLAEKCPSISPAIRQDAINEARKRKQAGGNPNSHDGMHSANNGQQQMTGHGLETLADAALNRHAVIGEDIDDADIPPNKRIKMAEILTPNNPPPSHATPSSRGRKNAAISKKGNGKEKGQVSNDNDTNISPPGFENGSHPMFNGPHNAIGGLLGGAFNSDSGDYHAYGQFIDPELRDNYEATLYQTHHDHHGPEWTGEASQFTQYQDEQPAPAQYFNELPVQSLPQNYSFHSEPQVQPASNVVPSPDFNAETGDGKRAIVQKARKSFNAEGKRKVKGVRDKGACMRCHMLKKECSEEGDPCDLCSKIKSPRIWTFPCTRERLFKSFDHFKSGIYSSLAYEKNIALLEESSVSGAGTRHIEVTQFPQIGISMTFKARQGRPVLMAQNNGVLEQPSLNGGLSTTTALQSIENGTGIDDESLAAQYHLAAILAESASPATADVQILEHESDDLLNKMQDYVVELLNGGHIIATEPSTFVKTALEAAATLSDKSEVARVALEMFTMVNILLDEKLMWSISQRSEGDAPGSGTAIVSGTESHRLIELQLRAAAEKKAGNMVEKVSLLLEDALAKKGAKQRYDLFIAGLLLLITLEKATWLFMMWDRVQQQYPWPLIDQSPAAFVDKRGFITRYMSFFLRVKDVPATTKADQRGVLQSQRDDESAEFYKKAQLSEVQVLDALNMDISRVFDPNNSRCFEGSLCAWLILPLSLLPADKVARGRSVSA